PGAYAPNGLPADPHPALYPGAPIPPGVPAAAPPAPAASSLPELLLPTEAGLTSPGGTP
ncbi:mammalian cell entry protein, partial [Mycolicibacter terrae]